VSRFFSLPWKQLSKFVIVGVINTITALAIYWGALWLGAPYWMASGISLILGILISFQSHSRYVFGARGNIARYVGVWLLIYALNLIGLRLARTYVGDYAAVVVLLPLNVALSYFFLRVFVFRTTQNRPDNADPVASPTAKHKETSS
jgi:putative flippase GtrA